MLTEEMLTVHHESLACRHAVRVDPSVELHLTLMTQFDHECHRVPDRHWRPALLASQESAPWLILALVESIALGTHLKDDGIEACVVQHIDELGEISLALLRTHALVAILPSRLDPCTTELRLSSQSLWLTVFLLLFLCIKVLRQGCNKNHGKKQQY